jgi:hypothetical protein
VKSYTETWRDTLPNHALEPTASSVRCAPASGGGSPRALGVIMHWDYDKDRRKA